MEIRGLKYGLGGEVLFAQYATGETAIQITSLEGTVAVATVNLQAWGVDRAPPGHVWVKTWSENEGMDKALIAGGVVEPKPVVDAMGGYGHTCRAVLFKLTPAALAELKFQRG